MTIWKNDKKLGRYCRETTKWDSEPDLREKQEGVSLSKSKKEQTSRNNGEVREKTSEGNTSEVRNS